MRQTKLQALTGLAFTQTQQARTRIGLLYLALGLCLALCTGLAQAHHSAKYQALKTNKLRLASVSAAVSDLSTNRTLFSKNADRKVPIASITKVMTAMVVLDAKLPLNEYLTVTRYNHKTRKNTYSRIRVGSRLKRRDLIRLSLMSSENLASAMLAKHYPGGVKQFVADMNRKARALGMRNTRFVDSSGLSPRNVSTAGDLTKMITAAMRYPLIKKTSTTGKYTANFRNPNYRLAYGNTNPLVRSKRWEVALSKTGYLREAGRCLIMVAEVDGAPIAMVFLDSLGKRTPLGDAGRVKRWLTTGESGPVPKNARNYERAKSSRET